MMQAREGQFDIRLSADHTQVLVTISPPQGNGKDVSLDEILARLSRMNAGHNPRIEEIREGINHARISALPHEVVGAQGVMPKDGQDAKIRHTLPEEVLRQHPPKHPTLPGAIDWFVIDSLHLVQKGQELASIIPAQMGTLGKTCTLPAKDVPYRPGKPANLAVGSNVLLSPDGLHAHATEGGYFYLNGERLTVAAFEECYEEVSGGSHAFKKGALFYDGVSDAHIKAEDFISIQGLAKNTTLRVNGDVLLQDAENCVIITPGNVYVEGNLVRCDVKARKRVVCNDYSQIIGGAVRAYGGIVTGSVGSPEFEETTLEVSNDHYTPMRDIEIEQELLNCSYNIQRIQNGLKPFKSSAAHKSLTEERRQMINKLHACERAQVEHIRLLREEKRHIVLLAKERISATIEVQHVYPGVWIRNGRLQLLIELPLQKVGFVEAQRGTAIQSVPLAKAS